MEVYLALRARLGRTAPFQAAYAPSNNNEVGDLSIEDVRVVIAAERQAQAATTTFGYQSIFASGILNMGNVMITYNSQRQGRCLAFGTSFSTRLVPDYASDFREVVFCYGTSVDQTMVPLVQPDCVICEIPERFLHFLILSVEGSTVIGLILGLHNQRDQKRPTVPALRSLPDDVARLATLLIRPIDEAPRFVPLVFETVLGPVIAKTDTAVIRIEIGGAVLHIAPDCSPD